jgi:crotonobetainyl-CoA:carnitine CoA-transferase CaiB-like acyl-CoA transferase
MTSGVENTGPLKGVRVFDMTRILAGPSATQILGDLGADILKIEKPGAGDDTRKWGPPYLKNAAGEDTAESAYYLSANRNKRSLSLDFTKPEGLALAKKLIGTCDILFENYKAGSLEKYGLGYEQLKEEFPRLIYCSVTGFGHDGPYADRAGYDFLIQGMGGLMSITGQKDGEPGAEPMKVGVAVSDLITGLNTAIAILAAVIHQARTGEGQSIDMALFDAQVSGLANQAMSYLAAGTVPGRLGNAHPNIVPYQVFPTADGHLILAISNDNQFRNFAKLAGISDIAAEPRFARNAERVASREALIAILKPIFASKTTAAWIAALEAANIPCGPINSIDQVFSDPQAIARGLKVTMEHPVAGSLDLVASPLRLEKTPPEYRLPPPLLGQHTSEILGDMLEISPIEQTRLREAGVIG